jgi:uncharacterized membrane protein YsdA (DUF1294 family)
MAGLLVTALMATVFGAVGSVGLLRHAQEHPPPLLVVLFVIWVAAPFAALAVANIMSTRWPRRVRLTLYVATILVASASIAVYLDDNISHRTAKKAFVYVAVPPVSVIACAVAVAAVAVAAKKRGR